MWGWGVIKGCGQRKTEQNTYGGLTSHTAGQVRVTPDALRYNRRLVAFFSFIFFFQILLRLKSATKVLSVHCVILKKREASSKQRRTDTETKVEPEFQILIFAKQAVETDHR